MSAQVHNVPHLAHGASTMVLNCLKKKKRISHYKMTFGSVSGYASVVDNYPWYRNPNGDPAW